MTADVTREPTGGQELREAMATVLSDWRARYGRAIPEADELIAALNRRGVELTSKGHPDCVDAVKFVAERHHGPDYPHCAAGWSLKHDPEHLDEGLELDDALPELTALIADAERVKRVRKMVAFYDRHEYSVLNVDDVRNALDGDQP